MVFYYLLIATLPFHADPRLGAVLFRGGLLVLTPAKLLGLVAVIAGIVSPRPSGAVTGPQALFWLLFIPFALVPPMATVLSGLPLPTDGVSETVSALLLFVATRSLVVTRERMIRVTRAIVLAFTLSSLWVYKEHFLQHAMQAWGPEGEPNYEALALLTPLALGICMARSEAAHSWRRIGLGCSILLSGALVLTESRAGLIAGLVLATVIILHSQRKFLSFALLAGTAMFLFAFGPAGLRERFDHIKFSGTAQNGDEISTRVHIELLKAGLRMIESHPLLGIGLNQFKQAAPEYNSEILAVAQRSYIAHDTFLQMGAEAGLPVLLIFVSLVIVALRSFRRVAHFDDPPLASMAVAFEAALIGISVAACSITAQLFPFWLLVNLSFSLRYLAVEVPISPSSATAVRPTAMGFSSWRKPTASEVETAYHRPTSRLKWKTL